MPTRSPVKEKGRLGGGGCVNQANKTSQSRPSDPRIASPSNPGIAHLVKSLVNRGGYIPTGRKKVALTSQRRRTMTVTTAAFCGGWFPEHQCARWNIPRALVAGHSSGLSGLLWLAPSTCVLVWATNSRPPLGFVGQVSIPPPFVGGFACVALQMCISTCMCAIFTCIGGGQAGLLNN